MLNGAAEIPIFDYDQYPPMSIRDDNAVYLRLPGPGGNDLLHWGRALRCEGVVCTVEFVDPEVQVFRGQFVELCYYAGHRFVRQHAKVGSVYRKGERFSASFELLAEPEPGENRQCFRVSPRCADLTVTLAEEPACRVIDVSANGLAVRSRRRHERGDSLAVTLCWEGHEVGGEMTVQSVRDLDDGTRRYGLQCLDERTALGIALGRLSAELQRALLAWMAGSE